MNKSRFLTISSLFPEARHKAALWVYVWAYTWACVSGVRLHNGVYEDLVLAIDPDMAMDTVNITHMEQKITVRQGFLT